jgi:hypothetical protein
VAEVISGYVIGIAAKQSTMGWASRPSSFPRTRSREARDRLDPGSKSGVTNDRQSRVPRGTVPPMGLHGARDVPKGHPCRDESRGTRDLPPRNNRVSKADKKLGNRHVPPNRLVAQSGNSSPMIPVGRVSRITIRIEKAIASR